MALLSQDIAGVYLVGGAEHSGEGDCNCYAVQCEDGVALIDCGLNSADDIIENMNQVGCGPQKDKPFVVFLTHAHIDHIGAAHQFQSNFPHLKFVAHDIDTPAIQGARGTSELTAESWYGMKLKPVQIDERVMGDIHHETVGNTTFHFLHTPGHTPGSSVVYFERAGHTILFGQDLHGPFLDEFHSDLNDYHSSMEKILALNADVLGEGHYGVFVGKQQVERFIRQQIRANTPR